MANKNLSQIVLDSNDPAFLITERFHDQPAILSTQVAERFLKNHSHLLRDIGNLLGMLPPEFARTNFGRIGLKDAKGEKRPAYLLTRNAFTLLVMGMTGKTAVQWKIRYIEAFNALEKAAADRLAELSAEAAYLAGRQEALCLPIMEAERKKGYLEGLKEGKRLAEKNDRLDSLIRIRAYIRKGLSYSEIGKLLGLHRSTIGKRITRAKKLGLWPEAANNGQTSLFGDA